MSLPTQRDAEAFLTPLRAKSTVFLLDNRATDLLFSRFLLSCLVRARNEVQVADINAFYSSNAQRIAPGFDAPNISLSLPPPGFAVEPWLIDFLIGAADEPFRSPKDLENALSSARDGLLQIEFRRGASVRPRRVVARLGPAAEKAA